MCYIDPCLLAKRCVRSLNDLNDYFNAPAVPGRVIRLFVIFSDSVPAPLNVTTPVVSRPASVVFGPAWLLLLTVRVCTLMH